MLPKRWTILLATAVMVIIVPLLQAHGGGDLVITQQPVGKYAVSVWLNPPSPRANKPIHITLGITDAQQSPVLGVPVRVALIVDDRVVESSAATTEQSVNRLFYEADFYALAPELYTAVVTIDGVDGPGTVQFSFEVAPSGDTNVVLLSLLGLFFLVVTVCYRSWNRR